MLLRRLPLREPIRLRLREAEEDGLLSVYYGSFVVSRRCTREKGWKVMHAVLSIESTVSFQPKTNVKKHLILGITRDVMELGQSRKAGSRGDESGFIYLALLCCSIEKAVDVPSS